MGCIGDRFLTRLVLDIDAAKHRGALEVDPLEVWRGYGIRLRGIVGNSSEYACGLHHGAPIGGNADFSAAENGIDFDSSGIPYNIGLAEIDFKAAKYRVELGELEIAGIDFALSTPENRCFRSSRKCTARKGTQDFMPRLNGCSGHGVKKYG